MSRFSLLLALVGCGRIGFGAAGEDAGAPADAPADAAFDISVGECPPAYTFVRAGCYRLENVTAASWAAAQADCVADLDGAHLAVIGDATERADVLGFLAGAQMDLWIGVTDAAEEGVFLDATGAPQLYLPWGAGEPTGGATENCVKLEEDADFDAVSCSIADDYLCEYDGIPGAPAAGGG